MGSATLGKRPWEVPNMRYVKEFAVVLALLMLAGCAGKPVQESPVATDEGIPAGQIYLYGEIHGIAAIEEYEAERWFPRPFKMLPSVVSR